MMTNFDDIIFIWDDLHEINLEREDGKTVIIACTVHSTGNDVLFLLRCSGPRKYCWQISPNCGGKGNHFFFGKEGASIKRSEFLELLYTDFKEDFEFFLWHPEIFEGRLER